MAITVEELYKNFGVLADVKDKAGEVIIFAEFDFFLMFAMKLIMMIFCKFNLDLDLVCS